MIAACLQLLLKPASTTMAQLRASSKPSTSHATASDLIHVEDTVASLVREEAIALKLIDAGDIEASVKLLK
eukprot:jgi/Chlat1/4597/Chrsp290S04344